MDPTSGVGPPRSESLKRSPSMPRALPFIVLLAILLRLFVLHEDFDAVSIPAYELSATGNLAKIESAVEGGIPIHRYYDNCGARLVAGYCGAALYEAVDDSYLTLKIVPMAFGLLGLLLLWWLLDRHFDRRTANLAALLFATVPPTLVRFSMIAMGSHFEALPFQFAVWLVFLDTHARGVPRGRLFATGVAAGFSVFVSFGAVVLLSILAVQHLLMRGAMRTIRDLAVVTPGLLLGLAPLIWIQVRTGGRPITFAAENIDVTMIESATAKAREFVTDILPHAATFADVGPIPGGALDALLLILYSTAWVVVLADVLRDRARPGLDRWKLLPPLLHLPVFTLFLLATNFNFDAYGEFTEVGRFRYLVPSFAFASVLVAAAATRTPHPARRLLGMVTLLLAPAALCIATEDGHAGLGSRYPGHSIRNHARIVLKDAPREVDTGRFVLEPATWREELTRFDQPMRREVLFGLGHLLALDVELCDGRVTADDLLTILHAFPPEDRIDVARGAGSLLRTLPLREGGAAAPTLEALTTTGEPLAHHVAVGMALPFRVVLRRDVEEVLERNARLRRIVPPRLQPAFTRGVGLCAGLLTQDLGIDLPTIVRLRNEARVPDRPPDPEFWFGVGVAYAEAAATLSADVLDPVPPPDRRHVWTGYGTGLRRRLGEEGVRARWEQLLDAAPPPERAALRRGLAWNRGPIPMSITATR